MTTTQDTSQTSRPATSEWHWVMTVQASGGLTNTRSAVITVPDGFTRTQVFEYVLKQFRDDYGNPLVVLFFDLQPNRL